MAKLTWNEFRTKHKGQGYSIQELSKMYKAHQQPKKPARVSRAAKATAVRGKGRVKPAAKPKPKARAAAKSKSRAAAKPDYETEFIYQRAKFYDPTVELKRSNYKKLLGDGKWKKALFGQNWHYGKPLKKHFKKLRLVSDDGKDVIEFNDMKGELFTIDFLDQGFRGHPLVTGSGADPIYILKE
jgi:hypothetical protein